MVQDSLRRTVYHPNLQVSNINVSGTTAEVKRNSSDLGYDGFEMCFQSNSSSENVNLVNNKWETAVFGQETISIPNGSLVTNNSSQQHLYCVGTEYPLSLTSGSIEIDLTQLGADRDKEGEWAVGLTRCVRNQQNLDAPNYYVGDQEEFWDYMVTCEIVSTAPMLKIFQSLYDANFGAMVMQEFDYRQSRDEDKGNYVNLNASNIESIRFTGTGEQMKIESFSKVTGKYEILVDGTNASSVLNLKPINQCCWNMYPKFKVPNGAKIGIMKQNGVNITGHIYGSQNTNIANTNDAQVNVDWWATMVNLSRQQFCENVDSRFMINTDQYQPLISKSFTQTGLNAITGSVDFNNVMILAESDLYTPTFFASTSRLLGFPNRPILDAPTSQSGTKVCFVSDIEPKIVSAGSVFVRLKNFSLNSQNFAKGSQSKIVYHLPRFDNSGNEVGALFFEPSERMYLKLNNPNPIYLNDIDVEFVYSDEKLCTSLVGKSIVCFHVRRSADPL